MLAVFRKALPKWDARSHKGLSGRIAVVGGSRDYTGAPFFAAMAAMRAGADLATVFCDEPAATAIKAYSPDVIVSPDLLQLRKGCARLERMHALVVGPGLGREEPAGEVVAKCVEFALAGGASVVLDADALWFLAQSPELRETIRAAADEAFVYATPNAAEMARIRDGMGCADDAAVVSWFDGSLVLVQKGVEDVITAGDLEARVEITGAKKRVGGQGDILAGIIGLFAFWAKNYCDKAIAQEEEEEDPPTLVECKVAAAAAACMVTRRAAEMGFDRKGRSLVASDILGEIGTAFDEMEYGTM